MCASKTSKYIVQELKMPAVMEESVAEYAGVRVLWLDHEVVEGAFHTNTAWYTKATTNQPQSHTRDKDEIIGFFGNNPADPYDLGGEIEIWLEDERYTLTRTTMIFAPAGMRHSPLIVRRVDRPIFHFTTVTGGRYEQLGEGAAPRRG